MYENPTKFCYRRICEEHERGCGRVDNDREVWHDNLGNEINTKETKDMEKMETVIAVTTWAKGN